MNESLLAELSEDLKSCRTEHLLWCLRLVDEDFFRDRSTYSYLTDKELREIIKLRYSTMLVSCQIHQNNMRKLDILKAGLDRKCAKLDVQIAEKESKRRKSGAKSKRKL